MANDPAPDIAKEWKLPYYTEEQQDKIFGSIQIAGLSKRLQKDYFRAKEEFARLMALKLTPEVMGVNLVETAEILQDCIREAAREVQTSKTAADKINALLAVTLASRAQAELTMKMTKLYRAGQKQESEKPPKMNSDRAPSADIPFQVVEARPEEDGSPAKNGAQTPEQ